MNVQTMDFKARHPRPLVAAGAAEQPDEVLGLRIAGGDTRAFDLLYRRHAPRMLRLCQRMLRDREDASDASQEAWLRIHRTLSSGAERPRCLAAWMNTVAERICLDQIRTQKRGYAVVAALESGLASAATPSVDEEDARRADAQRALEDVARLTPVQRRALVLHVVEGLDHAAVAHRLRISPQRSAWLVAGARSTLRARRAGRDLDCTSVRVEADRLRVRNSRVRAHLEDCVRCAHYLSAVRGRRLVARPTSQARRQA